VNRLARIIFPYYWETLSLAAALGEWSLGCWILGMPERLAVHAIALVVLFALNRAAAVAFEVEDAVAPLRHRVGAVVLAIGFAAAGGTAGLVLSAAAWAVVVRAGGLSAEASHVAVVAPQWLGHEFHPVGWIAILGGIGLVVDGYLRGHRRLVVTRLHVTLPHLPRTLDGFRLVQVSDLHLGPIADRDALREAFDRVMAEEPDLVVVTGDIVDSPKACLALWLPELPRLRARHGVIAILGNHDRETGLDRVTQGMRDTTDWIVLRDQVHRVETPDGALYVAGLEFRPTPHEGATVPQLAAALPPRAPVVLLAHHPNAFAAAVDAGFPLTLAGHTHGGQVALPAAPRWNPARLLMTPYDAGTFVERDGTLHVNRGLGVSGQRVRIGAPREITVVTLRAPLASPA
jgi:predicted MPP superfamily phosphohydrolase